jgi:hypothetical protein
LVIQFVIVFDDTRRFLKFLLRQTLHADEEAAAFTVAASPPFYLPVQLAPAAKVEVPDAEIRPMGYIECGFEDG